MKTMKGFIPKKKRSFQKKGYPQIIHFNRVFHYKPSILGVPLFLETLKYEFWPVKMKAVSSLSWWLSDWPIWVYGYWAPAYDDGNLWTVRGVMPTLKLKRKDTHSR